MLRILLVDDDPLLLKSLRDILEADGHSVQSAQGGQAGIDAFLAALARAEPFAAVITDLGPQRATMVNVAETDWRTTLRPSDTARLFAAAYEITSETAFRSLFGAGPLDRSPSQIKTRLYRTIAEGLAHRAKHDPDRVR